VPRAALCGLRRVLSKGRWRAFLWSHLGLRQDRPRDSAAPATAMSAVAALISQ